MILQKQSPYFLYLALFLACLATIFLYNLTESFSLELYQSASAEHVGSTKLFIDVASPKFNQKIESPIKINGIASGLWFYEGSFIVKIFDANGILLGSGPVTTNSEGKTVSFSGIIPFKDSNTTTGKIVFTGADPSKEKITARHSMPVFFTNSLELNTECKISACSQQICSPVEESSTCENKEINRCYEKARCEIQKSGKCGWTLTNEFNQCVGKIES